ncbi:TPA: hypothetical protein RU621_001314 [Salmonella enterica]|nr:hypothetical protein [Salmonella enterica]HEA0369843.1 hypothetical protein [Salmonella enterica]HEA2144702.1 hypothetical protein [Salmonella enterica]HEA2153469.1 hypothetical protein [Salmonella enterica]
MTKTLNPTITITVSGPTGSGKSRVLAVIADVLKLIHGDCIIEAPDVKAEKEMCGDDYTAWHKPRSSTIFKLEEVNLPINTGRYSTHDIETVIKKLTTARENLDKAETEIRNKITQPDKKGNEYSSRNPNLLSGVVCKDHDDTVRRNTALSQAIKLIDQQLRGKIDPVTARAAWYGFMNQHNHTDLANYLGSVFNGSVNRVRRTLSLQDVNMNDLPAASPEQEELAEKISGIYSCVMSQLHGLRDTTRACKFWRKTLEEQTSKELLVDIIVHSIDDMHDYIEENKPAF